MRLLAILGVLVLIAACTATSPTETEVVPEVEIAEQEPTVEPSVEVPAELGTDEIDAILADLDDLDAELNLDAELAGLEDDLNW